MTVAKSALAINLNIQKVVLMQTVDRYDNKHDLNKYARQKLDEANKRANDSRIKIGKHNLECDGAIRASRFGDSRSKRVDGVHLRGNSGLMSYTRSVANILVAAGLASEEEAAQVGRNKNISFKKKNKEGEGWSQGLGRRDRAPRPAPQFSVFELATQNRFGPLQQGNC